MFQLKNFTICFLSILSIFISPSLLAQDFTENPTKPVHDKEIDKLSTLEILEDSLAFFADSMITSPMPEGKTEGNMAFIKTMKTFLKTEKSFSHPLTKLASKIIITFPPDKSFRVLSWEISQGENERRYYAVIQKSNNDFIPLIDVSDLIVRGEEDSVFQNNRWYGGLVYNILQKNIQGQEVYFFFSWNGSSFNAEKKIIDVFGFDQNNKAVFGAPLFRILEKGMAKNVNRFVLTYQRNSIVSLNFDDKMDKVIFDHCESQIGDPLKKYTYVPDGTYDGLSWNGQQWIMSTNVIDIVPLTDAPLEKPLKK